MKHFGWILPGERARHAAIAAIIALVLGLSTLLEPVDRLIWLVESRIDPKPVSGEIVFVETPTGYADATSPQQRIELAEKLRRLNAAGAKRIYLDFVLDEPSTARADGELAAAIEELGDKISLTVRLENVPGGEPRILRTTPEIRRDSAELMSDNYRDYTGIAWTIEPYRLAEGKKFDALSKRASDAKLAGSAPFPIDYNFNPSTIPNIAMDQVGSVPADRSIAGKAVFVGHEYSKVENAVVPGHRRLPRSFVAIYGAETLKHGGATELPWMTTLAAYFLMLCLAGLIAGSTIRRIVYGAIFASSFAFVYACAQLMAVPELAPAYAFFLLYAAIRNWSNRKLLQKMHDDVLDMPTFRAMEVRLAKSGKVASTAVVLAKIHRFDEVTSTLGSRRVTEYVQQIANRFKIADQELVVYANGGKYLGWRVQAPDVAMLESHLRGLRAIFAHPLVVQGTAVDVGITFAADATTEADAARKLAAASSTLERTTEAHEPVLLAEQSSDGDLWWSISLQAKIDKALEEGHIYPVYQPQLDLRSGSVVGAEALVRWKDPERGLISPSYFIEQCEHAGRMDHLTQHVLDQAIDAAQQFSAKQPDFSISVNISATLLRDYRVTDMVERVLARTGFNPRNLVLEITETARIADYDVANSVMERLRLLGIRLSIDDFGVGAASLETLLRLPFDELKIDRAFISRVATDPKARSIAQLLVSLGNQTGIDVVAEGVEDEDSLTILRASGCKTVQGYSISHPLDRRKFLAFQAANAPHENKANAQG